MMDKKLLGRYKNGNYTVSIYEDGTKIQETEDDEFNPEFPESIDLKITNKCDMGCKYCHESSVKDGKHGDILNVEFLSTLKPYTELAIGGGNPLEHPDLFQLLIILKALKVYPNITVNQEHFMKNYGRLKNLVNSDLIKGVGVSFTECDDKFFKKFKEFDNGVLHVINGVVTTNELKEIAKQNLKVLILGYKTKGRGVSYFGASVEKNSLGMYLSLPKLITESKIVSFDNLALEQLEVKDLFDDEDEWENFYMGDDGSHTMYIDLVDENFAKSSTSNELYDLESDIKTMFNKIRT